MDRKERQHALAIGENIAAIRKREGLSQEEFAALIGVSQGAVSLWENGDAMPRKNNIARILEAVPGIDADDVCSSDFGFAHTINSVSRTEPVDSVPLYGTISAGIPLSILPIEDRVIVPRALRNRYPHAYFLRVRGHSMDRVLPDGCFALVNPTNELVEGAVYAVCVGDGEATVKRVRVLDRMIELSPDSNDPSFEPILIDRSNPYTVPRLLGRVMWYTMPLDFVLE